MISLLTPSIAEKLGIYRQRNVKVGGSGHQFPPWQEVPKEMEEYFQWLHSQEGSSTHPVILANEAHWKLVSVHPFSDGNGRSSRLVMNLVLKRYHYPITSLMPEVDRFYFAAEQAIEVGHPMDFLHRMMAEACWRSLELSLSLMQKN
jgi:Fic family protein